MRTINQMKLKYWSNIPATLEKIYPTKKLKGE